MLRFFILDENFLCKQKIQNILSEKRFNEVILRDRMLRKPLFRKRQHLKPMATSNFYPFLRTYIKGVHFSLFFDKIKSKNTKGSLNTASSHNLKEIFAVRKLFSPDLIFISPVFQTKTHENDKILGVLRLFALINRINFKNFIVLGGVNEQNYKKIKRLDFTGKIKGFASIRNF